VAEIIKFGEAVTGKPDLMANGQHLSGQALCLGCKHEWVAVQELTSEGYRGDLECPACSGHRGQYVWPFQGPPSERVWTCDCGSVVFMLTEPGTRCVGCGRHQVF
jgi:hypothetical protein